MLNVFPSPQKPNVLLLTWGFGIFFSVTFFLSEALTKSQLQQSIKDPFYTSDWKVILRPFIVSLLLIFSLYLTGFNATNPSNLLSITIANGIMILFLPSILFFIYKFLYKKKLFYWKSYVMPLYKDFLWVCLTAAAFFSGSIALYKQFMGNNLLCLIVWVSLILIAYSIFIMVSCDLFIKFIKLLHDKEEDGTYWTIFYTDSSQEKSVVHITTNEIIKDSEGYYRISDSNRPEITLMIPISSIVRIDEYKKSSDISIKTGKKKIQKQQRNKSRKPRNLKELMIFFEDENFSLGKSKQRIVQIIQFQTVDKPQKSFAGADSLSEKSDSLAGNFDRVQSGVLPLSR